MSTEKDSRPVKTVPGIPVKTAHGLPEIIGGRAEILVSVAIITDGRRTASHAGRRQKLPGESPSVAAVSREASQMENAG